MIKACLGKLVEHTGLNVSLTVPGANEDGLALGVLAAIALYEHKDHVADDHSRVILPKCPIDENPVQDARED